MPSLEKYQIEILGHILTVAMRRIALFSMIFNI